jgi:hypothetical protein
MAQIKRMFVALLFCAAVYTNNWAQTTTSPSLLKGMYIQWGYNTEWYTRSTLHFKGSVNGTPHDFTLYNATAKDRTDIDGLWTKPLHVTVPQYNYRIGFYLNEAHTKAVELNFDHTKYIVTDNQLLHAKGFIGNRTFDKDTSFSSNDMHFEHTNGANFYLFNYVRQYPLATKKNNAPLFTLLWKAGIGFMIPKTDVTLFGKELDNKFHLAGYNLGVEGGGRWYASKRIFIEATAKTGFVNYTNALTVDGGKAQHSFGYIEVIGTLGYDIRWR